MNLLQDSFRPAMGMFIFAFWFSYMECQAEGKAGWAGNFPTWRLNSGPISFLYSLLAGSGKPLTGYHLGVSFNQALPIAALPFFFGLPFSWGRFFLHVAYFVEFSILQDLVWFIINPHYGISKFTKPNVEWYSTQRWILWLPSCYWVGTAVCILFSMLSKFLGETHAVTRNLEVIAWYPGFLFALIVLVGLFRLIAPLLERLFTRSNEWFDRVTRWKSQDPANKL